MRRTAARNLLPLLVLLFGASGQDPQEWKSIHEWWGSITYAITSKGNYSGTPDGYEKVLRWQEDESWTFELHLDLRSPGGAVFPGKSIPPNASLLTLMSWSHNPAKYPLAYALEAEGTKHSMSEDPGEIVKGSTDRSGTKSRQGAGTTLALAALQIDVPNKRYAFKVPLVGLDGQTHPTYENISTQVNDPPNPPKPITYFDIRPVDLAPVKFPMTSKGEVHELELKILDQVLPNTLGILKGSETLPGISVHDPSGKYSTSSATISWSWSPKPPPPMDLEIEAEGDGGTPWAMWRPKGGADEATAGSSVKLRARVVAKGQITDKVRQIKLLLTDVSREKGVCINFPANPLEHPDPDLAFLAQHQSQGVKCTRDRASISDPDPPVLEATLDCFDHGAWGEVAATAVLDSGRVLIGHVKGIPSEKTLRIPKRSKTSKIAEVWKSPGPDAADQDDQPHGDGTKGDGLTNYEEYRGFYESGQWKEGDPARKDIFIRDEAGGAAAGGITVFESLSKLRVHRMKTGELYGIGPGESRDKDKVVNFNWTDPSLHKVAQHGILIRSEPGLGGVCQAHHYDPTRQSQPKGVDFVGLGLLPKKQIVQTTVSSGPSAPKDYADLCVAHELFHCVNVYHHGEDPDSWTPVIWVCSSGRILEHGKFIRVLDTAGNDISSSPLFLANFTPDPIAGVLQRTIFIRKRNGLSSGDVSCIMRYDDAKVYIPVGAPNDRVVLKAGEEPCGGSLCTTDKATGTNLPPQNRFGECDVKLHRGKCASQILVNDAATAPDRTK